MKSVLGGMMRRVRGAPLPASRFLFGRDFFISYSRRDAAPYSAALASRLSKHFSCYLDQLATPRGEKLPAPISREVTRATVLVLVGSPGAIESLYVRDELQLFLETHRPLLLLDVHAALDRAPWDSPPWSNLVGVYRERESLESFERADPSPAVLDYLRDSFTFTKQDRRLRMASTAAAMLLATVPISATVSVLARRGAAEAAQRATEARAEEAAARASAEEQRRIAVSRRLAGESTGQMRERPDLGLLLAALAHDIQPTAEARRSLVRGLTFYPGLSRLIRDPLGGEVQALTVSADGRFFATGSHETITVWDGSALEARTRIQEEGENFRGFALSPDGSLLAACRSQHVTLVDATTGRPLGRIDAETDAVSFLGPRLLAVGAGIWDVSAPDRPVLKSQLSLDEGMEAVVGDPSGRFVVASTSKRVVLCSLMPFRVEGTLTDARDIGLTTLALSPNPEAPLVAATNRGGRLVVWNLETGGRVASLSLVGGLGDRELSQPGTSPGGDMFAVAFSRDGERVSSGSLRGRFAIGTLEELATASVLQQAPSEMRDSEMALFGMSGELGVRQFIYPPGIQALAYVGEPPRLIALQMDGALSVWDDKSKSPLEHLSPWPDDIAAHASHAFSADGRYALNRTSSPEHRLYVWGVGGGEPAVKLEPALGDRRLAAAAISADGNAIAAFDDTGADAPWRTLGLWDRSGTLLSRTLVDASVVPGMRAGTEAVDAVLGGPAPGRLLAAAFSNGAMVVWDVTDLSKPRLLGVHTFPGRFKAVAISPVGGELAVAVREGSVSLWDGAGPTVLDLATDVPGVVTMAFSQDGRTLTAFAHAGQFGEETSRLVAWDVRLRQPRDEWVMDRRDPFTLSDSGHTLQAETSTISPDGTTFAIADNDTVAIWDLESRALLGAFKLPQSVKSLTFAAGGDYLLAGHFEGVSRLDVGPRRLIARACEVAGRTLTPSEAKRFLGGASAPPTCTARTNPPADQTARAVSDRTESDDRLVPAAGTTRRDRRVADSRKDTPGR